MADLHSAPGYQVLGSNKLARRAYNSALDRLEAARDAGTISAADAAVQARSLYAAYQRRKDAIELSAFLSRHGLSRLIDEAA